MHLLPAGRRSFIRAQGRGGARDVPAACRGLKARAHGIVVERPEALFAFGGAQVLRSEEGYMAGSDPRKGLALAW